MKKEEMVKMLSEVDLESMDEKTLKSKQNQVLTSMERMDVPERLSTLLNIVDTFSVNSSEFINRNKILHKIFDTHRTEALAMRDAQIELETLDNDKVIEVAIEKLNSKESA